MDENDDVALLPSGHSRRTSNPFGEESMVSSIVLSSLLTHIISNDAFRQFESFNEEAEHLTHGPEDDPKALRSPTRGPPFRSNGRP